MDAYFASIEERDNPLLKGQPLAIGGEASNRGVISTANYIARAFGVKSAIPTSKARALCPGLILIPPRIDYYKTVSNNIMKIFLDYTDLVEPLSLDEAYLDVSQNSKLSGSATLIAQEIRNRIFQQERLTCSGGISVNKFIAKIASGWKKPNTTTVITPDMVSSFVQNLPVKYLHGVGPVMQKKLLSMNIKTCSDLYKTGLVPLLKAFGKFGHTLYLFSQGIDHRKVIPEQPEKSCSVEETFPLDLSDMDDLSKKLTSLFYQLKKRLDDPSLPICKNFIKIKTSSFQQSSVERKSKSALLENYISLLRIGKKRIQNNPIRLLGLGVRFESSKPEEVHETQLSLFDSL